MFLGSVDGQFARASVRAQPAVQQAAGNPEDDADDVGDPVVKVCAAIEPGLYELNGPAEGGRSNEDGQQPEAARTGEWEDQRGKGNEVDDFVAPLRRWGRRLKRPEHRDSQRDGHDEGHGYVEVLAHAIGCTGAKLRRQAAANLARSRLSGNRRSMGCLGARMRAKVGAGDAYTFPFYLFNQMRYDICYAIQ